MTNKLNEPMESPQTCAEIIEQMEAITNESVLQLAHSLRDEVIEALKNSKAVALIMVKVNDFKIDDGGFDTLRLINDELKKEIATIDKITKQLKDL